MESIPMKTHYKICINSKTSFQWDSSILFYIAIGAFYINSIVGLTTLMDIGAVSALMKIFRWIGYIFCILKICTQTYTLRSIFKIIVTAGIVFLSSYLSGYQTLLIWLLYILAAQNIDLRKTAKEVMIITLVLFLLVVLLAELGFIESTTQSVSSSSRSYLWSSGNTILLWGFEHHNYIGRCAFTFITCYIFLRFDKFKWFDLIPCVIVFYICYFVSKTRTAALLILAATLLVLFFKLLKFFGEKTNKNIVAFTVYFIMILSIAFSIFMCLTYNSGSAFYEFFDDLLTTRFSSANSIFSNYGFSILGQDVTLVSTIEAKEQGITAIVLDNAYMHLLIRFGLLLSALVIGGYFYSAKIALREKNYGILIIIAIIFVCGIAETWFLSLSSNPFLLLVSTGLYNQDLKLEKSATERKKRIKLTWKKSSILKG